MIEILVSAVLADPGYDSFADGENFSPRPFRVVLRSELYILAGFDGKSNNAHITSSTSGLSISLKDGEILNLLYRE
jgi:hypothetical protein